MQPADSSSNGTLTVPMSVQPADSSSNGTLSVPTGHSEFLLCRACKNYVILRDNLDFQLNFLARDANEKAYIFSDLDNVVIGRLGTTLAVEGIGHMFGNEVLCTKCYKRLGWKIAAMELEFQASTAVGPNNETLSVGDFILKSWKLVLWDGDEYKEL